MTHDEGRALLTLSGSGIGSVRGLQRWIERRIAAAALLIHDVGADPRLLELAPEECELLSAGGSATEIVVSGPEVIVRRIREVLDRGEQVVRLYGDALLHSEPAFEEVRWLAEEQIPFEAVVGHLYLEERAMDWRIQTLHHAGGMLVLPVRPGGLRGLRDSLLNEHAPDGAAAAFLRDQPPSGREHLVAGIDEMERLLRDEERSLTGIFLFGKAPVVGRSARWATGRSLLGLRVLVTRTEDQADALAEPIEERGGRVIRMPTIEIGPPSDWTPLDRAIEELESYDWLVFTSRNGVRFFFERLVSRGRDARALGGRRLACVGESTADELHARGLHPDLVPEKYQAEPLAELLRPEAPDSRFLLPRAAEAREELPAILREAGAEVDDIAAYQNNPPADLRERWDRVLEDGFDAVTFTSSSTIRHLAEGLEVEDLGPFLRDKVVACLGPVTASTARRYGLEPAPLPEEASMESLVEVLERAI